MRKLFVGILLISPVFAFSQIIDPVVALFFDACKECIEVNVDNVEQGRSEYGYMKDYGSWREVHVWYGDTIDSAVANFVGNISE